MKCIARFLALAALMAAAVVAPTSAFAADAVLQGPNLTYAPNMFLYQARVLDLSTAYTNATTTPTIIASASGTTAVTVPATLRNFALQYIRVCYSVDVTKATATTAAVQVFVNGAANADSKRYLSTGAGRGTISGCFSTVRTANTAQTVSLYGVSGDTNTMTVNAAYLEVWNITLGG